MKKNLLIILSCLIVVAFFAFQNMNRPVKSLKYLKTDHTLTSTELFSKYQDDESASDAHFLDQVIELSGRITAVDDSADPIRLIMETNDPDAGVICEMKEDPSTNRAKYAIGSDITIKGRCTGMLMDVVLIDCISS